MSGFFSSRLFSISLAIVVIASTLPLYVSGYILGLLTVAYYFGVFAMSWDLLFGFAGEVNFGPTFLIGVGAYTAGILNNEYGWSVYLCIVLGALASVVAGVVLALPALRVRGPYFGLTTLVAVLMLQNFIVVFAELTGGEIGLTIPDVITINAGANYWIALGFMTISALILYGLSQSRSASSCRRAARTRCRPARSASISSSTARRVRRQRVLLRPVRRIAGVLFRYRLGRHRGRYRGRGERDRRCRARRTPHRAGRRTRRHLPDRRRRILAADW